MRQCHFHHSTLYPMMPVPNDVAIAGQLGIPDFVGLE